MLVRAGTRLGREADGSAWRPAASSVTAWRWTWSSCSGDDAVEETVEWRHRPTYPLDPETGQGDAHVQYAFAAHRAVVDVDVELGLVKVVELACAQDVGRAMNPQAVARARSRAAAPRAWAWR